MYFKVTGLPSLSIGYSFSAVSKNFFVTSIELTSAHKGTTA